MERDISDYFTNSKFVKELKPKDFDPIVSWKLKNNDCAIVLFYASWCPHCKEMKEEWNKLGRIAAFFNVYAYNCEINKIHFAKIREDMPQLVKSFPTMIVYKNGHPSEQVAMNKEDRNSKKLVNICIKSCKK